MATSTNNGVQPALLFMPDISGFTEFVNNNEIMHAQQIIQEVLEIIIESNKINLEVGEIEGDAVFFYRIGDPPPIDQLLDQVKTMFTKFHQHLNLYEMRRICPCTACANAVKLSLKIVAHFGEVSGYSVKTHRKLFGRDVIVLHRLLKNNLGKKEYALLTLPLIDGSSKEVPYPEWFLPEEASETYDVGEINFKVGDLSMLRDTLPLPDAPKLRLSAKAKTVFTESCIIQAPMPNVFGPIYHLDQRSNWMEGVKKIEMVSKDLLNRVGTTHRCIINDGKNPLIVTEYAQIGSDGAELVEMDKNGNGGCRYKVEPVGENETRIKIEILIKNNPVLLMFFNLFMKNKMRKRLAKSLENLNAYVISQIAEPVKMHAH